MNEIAKSIISSNLETFLNELLFEKVPHIFRANWEMYRLWRILLGTSINVDPCEIVVIGSAAAGYSLNPYKNLKEFDSSSDVDVAIISDYYFSEAWYHLRTIDPTIDIKLPRQRDAIKDHQTRYIYWGCIATDRILSMLPFAHQWLEARTKLTTIEPTTQRKVNFRIYKDFRALRGYQLQGLKKLRAVLLESEEKNGTELP